VQNIFSELKTDSRFIRFVMKVGSPSPMDPDEQHRRIPAVFVLMIISVATAVSGIYHCSSGKNPLVVLDVIGFILSLIMLLYLRQGKNPGIAYGMISTGFVLLCCAATVLGRTEMSLIFWALVLPAGCFSILGRKMGMFVAAFFFFINLLLMNLPEHMILSKPFPASVAARFSVVYLILTFMLYYYESSHQMLIRYIRHEENKFQNASRYDPLTGLSNRRDILEKMENERERHSRLEKTFTLIMGDIDNFKMLNDTLGHEAGDYVLQTIGRILKNQVRGIDCSSRWGDDEFLILLVDTDLEGGQRVAERIRKKVENTSFQYQGKGLAVTMTFGLSIYQSADEQIDACVRRSDDALEEGKRQGKNRVVPV
jgi:diguanylate cyclase (GGDEF)-like protein